MARVQIPAGAFSERSEKNRPKGVESGSGASETTVVQIPAGASVANAPDYNILQFKHLNKRRQTLTR
jgi:hypothetical protein